MTIKVKIISGFAVLLAISIFIGGFSLISLRKITHLSQQAQEPERGGAEMSKVISAHYIWRQNMTLSVYAGVPFTGSFDPQTCALGQWRATLSSHSYVDNTLLSMLAKIDAPHSLIHHRGEDVIKLLNEGRVEEARDIFNKEILPNAATVIGLLHEVEDWYEDLIEKGLDDILQYENQSMVYETVFIILAVIIGVILAFIITQSVTTPINRLIEVAENVAVGNLKVNIDTSSSDETGRLSKSFSRVVQNVNELVEDILKLINSNETGEIEDRMDTGKFVGSFKEVAEGVNNLYGGLVTEVIELLGCLSEFSQGNFQADVSVRNGKKIIMNQVVNGLRDNLMTVNAEINSLVMSVVAGDLAKRVNSTSSKGDWAALLAGLDKLMEEISEPAGEIMEIMQCVAAGDFTRKMNGDYKGDFLAMKGAVNTTVTNIASYIEEITQKLECISNNDLTQYISRDYVGSFSAIKDSYNHILSNLNTVIGDIATAAEQVSSGSRSIADSSMTLATGASEQAASVEELSASITIINESTGRNAENAKLAEKLSGKSKTSAANGDDNMKSMLISMEAIKDSSTKIINIIKVIQNISSQTNLLALNAAVEAARAGEHGKGFTVVAEEVRNLASKSQEAAKQTADLIDESISRVSEGTEIAQQTADALKDIISSVGQVADIITDISTASQEQKESIGQITQGLAQITNVVQNNSSTSEETASASEELSSQADVMNSLVGVFKIK
ncbi:MAG: methyl-accepting chemotaxis protein [Defluviitaleaceae bacterium]|nr:methyl-accepting chemotaxis protein [Defluviitaleaceae bacterium]